jgi:hypothetical protein
VDVSALVNSIMVTQEYIINHMLLPGQIENWVVVVDMGN